MRKPARAGLLTLFAAAFVGVLGTTSSFAATPTATTFTVKPGGAITGKAGTTTLTDATSGLSISCKTSTLTGSLKKGSKLAGAGIGKVTKVAFNNCSVDGITLSISSGAVTWPLNAVTYKSGVTAGTITKIHFSVKSSECSAVVDGTSGTAHNGKVAITYTNSTGVLKILSTGGTLHIYDVQGCLGAVSNKDKATISSSYKISPKQTIT